MARVTCDGQCHPFSLVEGLRGGTHPLAAGPGNPGLLSRTGRSDRQRRWVPQKPGTRPTNRFAGQPEDGVSRFGGQAGTQAPDPMLTPPRNRGSRAGSTTLTLPADSVVPSEWSRARSRPPRSSGYGPPVTWWRWICRLWELGGAVTGPAGLLSPLPGGFSADDREDLSGTRQVLELVAAAAFQPDGGVGDQVLDGAGDPMRCP